MRPSRHQKHTPRARRQPICRYASARPTNCNSLASLQTAVNRRSSCGWSTWYSRHSYLRRTKSITDPAPMTIDLEQRRHRRVRCIRLLGYFVIFHASDEVKCCPYSLSKVPSPTSGPADSQAAQWSMSKDHSCNAYMCTALVPASRDKGASTVRDQYQNCRHHLFGCA